MGGRNASLVKVELILPLEVWAASDKVRCRVRDSMLGSARKNGGLLSSHMEISNGPCRIRSGSCPKQTLSRD